jgi:hypothetical protein
VECDADGWQKDEDGEPYCVNEMGTYYIDNEGTIYYVQLDGLYGWWLDTDENYDEFICDYIADNVDKNYRPANKLHCEGEGYEDDWEVTWYSNTYYYEDGSTYSSIQTTY